MSIHLTCWSIWLCSKCNSVIPFCVGSQLESNHLVTCSVSHSRDSVSSVGVSCYHVIISIIIVLRWLKYMEQVIHNMLNTYDPITYTWDKPFVSVFHSLLALYIFMFYFCYLFLFCKNIIMLQSVKLTGVI